MEDDAVTRKVTELKLQAAGYTVLGAADGSEAIEVIGQTHPELVLLDLNFPPDVPHGGMPSWDGFRLMLWLRSVTNVPGNRFIIITSGVPPEYEARIRASGVAAFFNKPVNYKQLLAVIKQKLSTPPSKG